MNNKSIRTCAVLLVIVFSSLISIRCSEDSPVEETPVKVVDIVTNDVTGINSTHSEGGGSITVVGVEITARGVCWSTSRNPTTADNKTDDGSGPGDFSSSISGLAPNTSYYVRAFGVSSEETYYGNETSFTTPAEVRIAKV